MDEYMCVKAMEKMELKELKRKVAVRTKKG